MKGKVFLTIAILLAAIALAMPAEAYTYDRLKAVEYAKANWNKNVPGSWYFNTFGGGDCTNFVSHALKAGGWSQRKTGMTWYYDSYQFHQYSNSWTTVAGLRDFTILSQRGKEISFTSNDVWARPTQFTIGDVIQMDGSYGDHIADGIWDHTMIITDITGNDVLITYHTSNNLNKKMSELVNNNPSAKFRVLLMKNTHSD
jgi:hypothetical protein